MNRKEIIKEYITTLTHTYNYNPWYSRKDYAAWKDVIVNAKNGVYLLYSKDELKTEIYWLHAILKDRIITYDTYKYCKEMIKLSTLHDLHFIARVYNEIKDLENIYISQAKSIDIIKREFFKTVRRYESKPENCYIDLLICGEDNITKHYTYSLPLIHYCTTK